MLNSIIDIPVNTIKLDRIFITNCTTSRRGIYFLQRIIEMIQGLGYHVICEGVESEEQAQILRAAGCKEAQGYLFSKPLTIEKYEEMCIRDRDLPGAETGSTPRIISILRKRIFDRAQDLY